MAVKYTGGGGGLFSSFLPSLLQLGGAALGGPVGAGIGGALGSAINGGSVGDMLTSGASGYLNTGMKNGFGGNFKNPLGGGGAILAKNAAPNVAISNAAQNVMTQHIADNAPDLADFYAGAHAPQNVLDDYARRNYGWGNSVFNNGMNWR